LAAATTVARNIYQKIFKPDVAQKHLVLITRILVVAFAIFGLLISVGAKWVVFWMILFAYVGSGAALGIPLIAGLYWKKATRTGCIASMIAGALTVIIWKMTPALKKIIFEGVPGLIIALLVLIIVSLMTQRSPEAEKDYEEVLG
jgi:Na+/proline symporter